MNIQHPEIPDLSSLYGVIFTDGNDQFSQESTSHVVTYGAKQPQVSKNLQKQVTQNCMFNIKFDIKYYFHNNLTTTCGSVLECLSRPWIIILAES